MQSHLPMALAYPHYGNPHMHPQHAQHQLQQQQLSQQVQQQHQQQQQQLQQHQQGHTLVPSNVSTAMVGVGGDIALMGPDGSRGGPLAVGVALDKSNLPQWGYNETKKFIEIRADLEKDFTQTKRNKTLWELISGKMKEAGYRRSADQCKCKWKNLVNRYKGKETSDGESGRACPFFEELDAIFRERARNMDRLQLDPEARQLPPNLKPKRGRPPKNDAGGPGQGPGVADEDTEEDMDDEDGGEKLIIKRRKKDDKEKQRMTADKHRASNMQEVLTTFLQQQQQMEKEWRETVGRREEARRQREVDWRRDLEKLERERLAREDKWKQEEELRRVKEESRAEKRDLLFAALIASLKGGPGGSDEGRLSGGGDRQVDV